MDSKKEVTNKVIALGKRQSSKQTLSFIQECPLDDYDALTRERWVANQTQLINATEEEEEQQKLKKDLPFRSPHYTRFNNNHRAQADIDPESFTWQTCVDVDNIEQVEMANQRSEELNRETGMWQDMMLHKDFSARKKLHIDIRLPLGMTVPEAQRAYCEALGVDPDTNCFSTERCIYITPANHEIYRSEKWYEQLSEEEIMLRRKAYTDRGLTIDGRTDEGKYYDPKENSGKKEEISRSEECGVRSESRFPDNFKGVPYSSIISEYWHRTGGEPQKGERNARLHKLAVNLRAICDNRKEMLMAVMPRYELSESEMRGIVDSACKEPTKGSRMMDQIVSTLKGEALSENLDDEEEDKVHCSKFKVQSKKLPIGLKESLVGVPKNMQMPVLCSVLPIAGAYADQVEVEYCDGNHQHLGLMSIILGEQASGKSVCKHAVDVWKRQFEEEDALARKREEEWKERKKSRKANEKAPDDPHVLIRMMPVTVSCSTLLKRFKNANGHTLYSFGEELDTLRKTNGAGSWSSKYDIYRLSFDRGEWGQDYNSDQAESGVVNVAYNWTILGTYGAMRKCFKSDNIENGLSSRMLIAEMPDNSFSKMPRFRKRSKEDEARIQEAVTKLRSYSGLIDTPRLRKAIEQWVEEKRVEAAKDIDHVKDTYRKRAAVIGFRAGVIFHLLSLTGGQSSCEERESKACIDFALMMAEYCMEQQIKTFGEALLNQYIDAQSECQRYGSNHSVFDQLAPSFSIDDLRALKRNSCGESAIRKIISRWYHDKWIEKVDKKHWRKMKTENGNL